MGELAEWLHAAAHKVQGDLMAATDADEVVRLAGGLAKLARGVRQCVLMQDRLEGQRLAAETAAARDRAEAEAAARVEDVERQVARVLRGVERRFEAEWPDTGDDDANEDFNERLERVDARLLEIAAEPDFLAVDADTLIARLCEEFGVAPSAGAQSAAPTSDAPTSPAPANPAPSEAETWPATAPPPQAFAPSGSSLADGRCGPDTS